MVHVVKKDGVKKVSHDDVGPVIHDFEPMKKTKVTVNVPLVVAALSIVVAGTITGYILAQNPASAQTGGTGGSTISLSGKKTVGKCDATECSDSVEGMLKAGGVEDGEGTHHLERPGGVSQNVYLTSSSVDLDEYLEQNVRVSGQTNKTEKAGWFMDVLKLEVL